MAKGTLFGNNVLYYCQEKNLVFQDFKIQTVQKIRHEMKEDCNNCCKKDYDRAKTSVIVELTDTIDCRPSL